MREVAVIGIGQTAVSEHWEKSFRELAGEAVFKAIQDADITVIDALYVGNMLSGVSNHQQHLGAYIADWIGMRGIESVRVEAACSSGSAAFRTALMAVASGEVDYAVAVGAEKMTDSPPIEITSGLATAADADWETDQGLSFVALNALIMRRYMHEYGWKHEDFSGFSINAHKNAVYNPNARFRRAITLPEYIKAAVVADPINILDASPIADGAAAAILVPVEIAKRHTNKVIRINASSAATDSIAVHARKDPLSLYAAQKSSSIAYKQAGISAKDIDLFELHDAFSIMAALSLEACGFVEKGKAPTYAIESMIGPHGKLPISTMGGLKARGHPVGATGMYQIIEVIQQLRHNAGENQVPGATIGMTQNIGGSGSNIITHILSTE